MAESLYEFDSGGDTDLVLVTNRLHFQWKRDLLWLGTDEETSTDDASAEHEESPRELSEDMEIVSEENACEEPAEDASYERFDEPLGEDQSTDGQIRMRLRVSSRHLILASRVFRAMLEGPFKEGSVPQSGRRQISASKWDPEALITLMNIIHGRHREVPRSLSLEALAHFAIVVDYYGCHEVVEVFANMWLKILERNRPSEYAKDCMLWLLTSWVFSHSDLFKCAMDMTLRQSRKLVVAMDLPIPGEVLSKIDQKRQEALTKFFEYVYNLFDSLCDQDHCSLECSCMLLGHLTKELKRNGILSPRVTSPFDGHSVKTVRAMVKEFKTLENWDDDHCVATGLYYRDEQKSVPTCNARTYLDPVVKSMTEGFHGLKLDDFSCLIDRN
ncbi:hypothetical protein CDD83_1003 [Cordyceps sp. RAO-2017]|nr:hypothetical protein CDD83_1003 [Cordyceps sp. RAO-2017]